MKIACQTITFGNEKHKMELEDIVKAVADAGYDGIETGFFRVGLNEAENYKIWLNKYNIKQAAIHIGGNFNDEASVKQQLENTPALIKFAQAVDCKNIFFSGSPSGDYKTVAENLNKLGKELSGGGLVLSYHNHDWEIKSDGLYALCDNTDPAYLSFVPDIGWVVRGGANPVQVLEKLGGRVSNLHFKEFTDDGKFTELGKGVVDFKSVYEFMKDRDMWIIAEQDSSEIGAVESVAQNYKYIKSLM